MEAAIELQQQRKPDRGLGGRQRQHHDEHDLAVGLRPAAAGGDEGERHGVGHDFEAHEHEQEVAPQVIDIKEFVQLLRKSYPLAYPLKKRSITMKNTKWSGRSSMPCVPMMTALMP